MQYYNSRFHIKDLSNSQNETSIKFDNVLIDALPDLVKVGLVRDADLAGGLQRNQSNLHNFGVNRFEQKRIGTLVLRGGYNLNFANEQYLKA